MGKFKIYPGTHQGLHWQWPFESKEWGENNNKTITYEHAMLGGNKAIIFDNIASIEPSAMIDWTLPGYEASFKIQRVNAPISGQVERIHRAGNVADLTIYTQLADGTRIWNTFTGLVKAPPKLEPGYEVAQGEWIGFSSSNYLGLGDDAPIWYCQAAAPGKKAEYVYADEAAEKHCNGIDWKDEFKDIPEMTFPATPAPAPKKSGHGMLLIGAAVAAYLVLGKGK